MFEVTDMQKIGVGLAGFGISFLILGILLLFDKGLLAIGNILFIVGLGCVIGLQRTFRFFFQRHKAKASLAFFGGIFIVLLGWPFIGMLIETYGFVLLFSGFFPAAVNFLRRVPVLGTFLNLPGISMILDQLCGDSNRTTVFLQELYVIGTFKNVTAAFTSVISIKMYPKVRVVAFNLSLVLLLEIIAFLTFLTCIYKYLTPGLSLVHSLQESLNYI